ncbi:anti-repressor SinI family protein [Bacillus sp. FJAT-27225]|uniref:anti-repressor SinI family protein n=1 Tax=Bacillus sp. FJAT-27225 TaxID=1743144 RepID=UPI0020C7EB3E|nr:anti-repressor SinI family protein [Bacillus sp. FJAT-27225]
MSTIKIVEKGLENLDQEWMSLIMEAREIGLGTDIVRDFLSKHDNELLRAAK